MVEINIPGTGSSKSVIVIFGKNTFDYTYTALVYKT